MGTLLSLLAPISPGFFGSDSEPVPVVAPEHGELEEPVALGRADCRAGDAVNSSAVRDRGTGTVVWFA